MSNSSALSQSPKAAYKIMYVINRLGEKEVLDTNKIVARIIELINREPKIPNIQPYELMCGVVSKITNNIPTAQLDVYTASLCASMSVGNPYYGVLAARIAIDNHQKNTSRSFTDKIKRAYLNKICDDSAPLISRAYKSYIEKNQDVIELMIDYRRDFMLDYFGFETFRQLYSLKTSNESPDKCMVAFERPQDLFMRVAVQMHAMTGGSAEDELRLIKETYDYLSQKCISHATPSYFNACKPLNQLAVAFCLTSKTAANRS